ncbi:MAG: hypothetical protein KatS3mg110_0294 [Pirellulaceae bacterium]|nr:MAG: hypothetical protein KatS3mg110_0294 [Pirellulaceae bacterium]
MVTQYVTQLLRQRFPHGIAWGIVTWLLVIHVGALAAPWTFTWSGLGLALILHWITGGIGICLGYHRLLTHRSFLTYRWVRYLLAIIGGLAGEGTALDWVANHRKHHALSDKEGDPHSPHDGPWWSHMLWLARAKSSGRIRGALAAVGSGPAERPPVADHIGVVLAAPLAVRIDGVLGRLGRRWAGSGLVVAGLGHLRPVGTGAALDVARQFRQSHVGLPQLRDCRRQPQQLVGGACYVW